MAVARKYVITLGIVTLLFSGWACSRSGGSTPSGSPVLPTADQTKADSWPSWLGPNQDGISTEADWSSIWPKNGLPIVWSRDIGIGFSSMSLADDRLFTMGHVQGKEIVYCLDANTGDEIWSHSYSCALVANLHEGGPCATPTIDGERVYTLGREGQLFCFQAKTGKVLWQLELQEDLAVSMPEWGFSASPYILGDQLILEAGRVASYNKATGVKFWQSDKHAAGYGSVTAFKSQGDWLIASLDCEGLRVLKAKDGAKVAYAPWNSPYKTNSTTPIVLPSQSKTPLIYVSTGYNIGCGLFRLDDGELELVYSNREMKNHFNNSILFEGHLYGVDGNSNHSRVVQLKCMDSMTGKVLWEQRGFGCGSLLVADGKLLILSDSGELILAEATPKGFQSLARSPFLDGKCWTVPAILHRRIYGRNAAGKLVCAELPEKK